MSTSPLLSRIAAAEQAANDQQKAKDERQALRQIAEDGKAKDRLRALLKEYFDLDLAGLPVSFDRTITWYGHVMAVVTIDGFTFGALADPNSELKGIFECPRGHRLKAGPTYTNFHFEVQAFWPLNGNVNVDYHLLALKTRNERLARECKVCLAAGHLKTAREELVRYLDEHGRAEWTAAVGVLLEQASVETLERALAKARSAFAQTGGHEPLAP